MSASYQTYTPQALLPQLEERVSGDRIVFARGGLAVSAAGIFYGIRVYHFDDGAMVEGLRGSIAKDDWAPCLEACRARYETTLGGRVDLDGQALVWTDEPPSFSAWLGGKPIWSFDEGGPLRGGGVEIASDEIQAVERFISDDWVSRGVRILRSDGASTVVVGTECDYVTDNYTYDAEELRKDTVWAGRLARALAESLNRPYADMVE